MTGSKELPTVIPFGPFEADLTSQELRKQGVSLRLPRQSFQILKMLLQRPGQLVTREELRAVLWPSDTFVDFEHSLNAAINRLREVLGDDADNPRYIETLPRRGYRLVNASAPEALKPPEAIPAAQTKPRQRLLVWLPLAATALLLAAVLFAVDAGGLRSKLMSRSAPQPQIRSLAVLPFTNLSGDPQQEYFADAMTEELITELSRIASLKIISRTSVMQYKGEKKKPLPQIGRELNVDALMEGSVLRSGNRVRIATQLIYAPTDQHMWVETYERDLGDVFKLEGEVAEAVAQQMRLKLTPEEQAHFRQARQVDPEALQAYQMAISFNWTQHQEIKRSQGYLEKAIQKDPSFAEAYVGLGRSYFNLGQFRWLSPRDAYEPAKQAARKALELDEKNCRGHSLLGEVSWRYDWDWRTAEREFGYAGELCPNDATRGWERAAYTAWTGHSAEALAEMEKTREIDPLSENFLRYKVIINYQLRDYKALIETSRSLSASRPNWWGAHYWLGVGYEGSGRTREAIPEYQKAVEISQGDSDPTAALAHAYATTGRKSEVLKILSEWQRQSETSYVSPYMLATVYAGLGEKDKAFDYLEKAYQERSSDLPYFLRADLRVDSLRSDPRFQDLLRRMNFPK